MTNGEKFKTAEERKVAYFLYCGDFTENEDAVLDTFDWLDAEYIPPPETMPDIIAEIRKKHPAEEVFDNIKDAKEVFDLIYEKESEVKE